MFSKCIMPFNKNFKNFAYYAGIMSDAFGFLLCLLLCWHNWLEPKGDVKDSNGSFRH